MIKTVTLHAAAPPKPAEGQPCNGCGLCCLAERCPVSLLFLPLAKKPCAALAWNEESKSYRCGLLTHPAAYLRWLPHRWQPQAIRWFARRIAAGHDCDFGATEV